jgi:hypothetical protein
MINPRSLRTHQHYDIMKDTVEYMLKNAVGIEKAKATNKLLKYLRNKGHNISRSAWQISVLGPLRDNGVFIAAKPGVGIFLIKTLADAEKTVMSMEHKIDVEKNRLQILKQIALQRGWNL